MNSHLWCFELTIITNLRNLFSINFHFYWVKIGKIGNLRSLLSLSEKLLSVKKQLAAKQLYFAKLTLSHIVFESCKDDILEGNTEVLPY